ncbi:MAG: flippase [Coriobacteriia bacterium]|nr:flippase [Coriobacteriia bacterium]
MARSLKKNFLYQAAWQLLLILTPLVTTPYLSRVLGASQVGVYSFTFSITNYFVLFAVLGMSTYGVREIAACGEDRARRSGVFWNAYAAQAATSGLVLVVYIAYMLVFPQGGFVVCLVWGMWVLSALLDVSWLLFGVEEFRIPTVRSIVTKLASVVCIFVFVRGPEDLWIYCAAIAGSYLANQMLLWPFVKRYVGRAPLVGAQVWRHFKGSLRLFVPVVAISLYVTLDKVMLGAMTNMVQTGFYEYSEKLSKMPMAVITAMGTVMLPRMTAQLKEGNRDAALDLLERSVWAMLALAFALMFGIMAIAPEFACVFLGEEFADCWLLMVVIALVIPVISTTNVLGRQYLLPTQRDGLFTLSVCVGAVVNVGLNLVLIPLFAALGAAVATVCAEVAVLVAQVLMTREELPLGTYAKNALPFAVCGAVMLLVVRLCAGAFNAAWGFSVQGLVLEILVGVAVFLLLALTWCKATNNPHLQALRRR